MKNYTNTAATILYMHGSVGRHTDREPPVPLSLPPLFPHFRYCVCAIMHACFVSARSVRMFCCCALRGGPTVDRNLSYGVRGTAVTA